eukprot:680999-Prorocentrum_minimum.AAC.1
MGPKGLRVAARTRRCSSSTMRKGPRAPGCGGARQTLLLVHHARVVVPVPRRPPREAEGVVAPRSEGRRLLGKALHLRHGRPRNPAPLRTLAAASEGAQLRVQLLPGEPRPCTQKQYLQGRPRRIRSM